jgi:hypothetical protein
VPDERATVLAFLHETVRACADAAEAHPLGTLFLTPSLPEVFSLNGVAVHDEQPDLTLDDLDALFASASARSGPPERCWRTRRRRRGS